MNLDENIAQIDEYFDNTPSDEIVNSIKKEIYKQHKAHEETLTGELYDLSAQLEESLEGTYSIVTEDPNADGYYEVEVEDEDYDSMEVGESLGEFVLAEKEECGDQLIFYIATEYFNNIFEDMEPE
jgi:hypothetical protein